MRFSISVFTSFLALVSATNTAPATQSHLGEVESIGASRISPIVKTVPKKGIAHGVGDDKCNGCFRGYCWSYCWNGIAIGNPWCYGSSTGSQDFNYQKCTTDDDCRGNQCFYCAGSCTV